MVRRRLHSLDELLDIAERARIAKPSARHRDRLAATPWHTYVPASVEALT